MLNEGEAIHFRHVAVYEGEVDGLSRCFERLEPLDAVLPNKHGLCDRFELSHQGFSAELVVVHHKHVNIAFVHWLAHSIVVYWSLLHLRCRYLLIERVPSDDVHQQLRQIVAVDGPFEDAGEMGLRGELELICSMFEGTYW